MSFSFPGISSLESMVVAWDQQAYADMIAVGTKVVQGIEVADADIQAGLAYMTTHLPQIESFLQTVASVVAVIPEVGAPTSITMTAIAGALAESQKAGTALAAYNADLAAGKPQTVAYTDLLLAFMSAKSAASTAATVAVTPAAAAAA